MRPIDDILSQLGGVRRSATGTEQYSALCPHHDDRNSSLSVSIGDGGQALIHCHAGCRTHDVLGAIGRTEADLFPEGYQRNGHAKPKLQTQPIRLLPDVEEVQDLRPLAERYAAEAGEQLDVLARQLGVSRASLEALGVGYCAKPPGYHTERGWCVDPPHWTIPEKDAAGRVVGIQRRFADGSKSHMPGTKRGLVYPDNWKNLPGPVLCPEGMSDVAAALTMGLCGIGRPSNTGGVEQLANLTREAEAAGRQVIILGENDLKPDGRCPGKEGAELTAGKLTELGVKVEKAQPPEDAKDLRGWLQGQNPVLSDLAEIGKDFLEKIGSQPRWPKPDAPEQVRSVITAYLSRFDNDFDPNPKPRPRGKPCRCGIMMSRKTNAYFTQIMGVRCSTWDCPRCVPRLITGWNTTIASNLTGEEPLYILRTTSKRWKSRVYQRTFRAKANYYRLDFQDGTEDSANIVIANHPLIEGVPITAEAARTLLSEKLNQEHNKKPIWSSRGWKMPVEAPVSGQWVRDGCRPRSSYTEMEHRLRDVGFTILNVKELDGIKIEGRVIATAPAHWTPEELAEAKRRVLSRLPVHCPATPVEPKPYHRTG